MEETGTFADNKSIIAEIAEEQRIFFGEHKLTQPLGSRELMLGSLALACVEDSSLHRGFPAKVRDNAKTDDLKVVVDVPTVDELADELVIPGGLSREDVLRLYVGTGLAQLLVAQNLPSRPRAVRRFFEALSQPLNLYNRAMDEVDLFEAPGRLETVQSIITGTPEQMARVNSLRLAVGMFIEVQPRPTQVRRRHEKSFHHQLSSIFDGKTMYLKTVGLFKVVNSDAEEMYADNASTNIALSFPLSKKEIESLLKQTR